MTNYATMSRYAGDDDEENWVAEEIGGEFEDGEDADDDVEIVSQLQHALFI